MKIKPLANEFVTVFESPSPEDYYVYSPAIIVLENGRLLATIDTMDKRPESLNDKEAFKGNANYVNKGIVFYSDDDGKSWHQAATFPFFHARPFVAGNSIYILGHAGDLMIIRSDDNGITWSKPSKLTDGESWHQAPCNVLYKGDNIYLVMEHSDKSIGYRGWDVCTLAPVLMRANVNDNLLDLDSWTFASKMHFLDVIDRNKINYLGIPFYDNPYLKSIKLKENVYYNEIGWLETNVVKIYDNNHYMYDENTIHLISRFHSGITNIGLISKVLENEDGTMTTTFEKAPSGKQISIVPLPGGQMKFHILYDDKSKLYWLLSSQATDSTTKVECLPVDRFGTPDNERHRLQLHFSKNCIDWCFAGLVATGNSPRESRHYASMAIKGDDLLILSRSGDARAKDAHNGNIITFHRIRNFRELIY